MKIVDNSLNNFFCQKVINYALKNNYVLQRNSPLFLRSNYDVILNSIRLDVNSANYVNWEVLSPTEMTSLIQEVINCGYELSSQSCSFLYKNAKVVLNSIKRNQETLCYASKSAQNNSDIFNYLIENRYQFEEQELREKPLSLFSNKRAIKYAFERLNLLDKDDVVFSSVFEDYPNGKDKYIERIIELCEKIINTKPTIENFKGVFDYYEEKEWNRYRKNNFDVLANIFGKICAELKNNLSFQEALLCMQFLNNMKNILGDKYNLLYQAMEEYHEMIHKGHELDDVASSRDTIARLSALYVSKYKERIKKDVLDKCIEDFKWMFVPKKVDAVYQKIKDQKKKEKFKKLYLHDDELVDSFINNIIEKYKVNLDEYVIKDMVACFVIDGMNKMEEFISPPTGFDDYERYKEAKKLINRLNSRYILYTDQELIKYLDIIKFDNKEGKYVYTGPSFSNSMIEEYKEYAFKKHIFEKIKQEIIFYIKKIDVDKEMTSEQMSKINDELALLPFNDKYYEFDEGVSNCFFTLNDFIKIFFSKYEFIHPSSILEDEGYELLTKYIVDNGLIWLALSNISEENDVVKITKNSFFDTMNWSYEIAELIKLLNYKGIKYSDYLYFYQLANWAKNIDFAILGQNIIIKLCKNLQYTEGDVENIVKGAKELISQMVKKDKSTVPYISGENHGYHYSMYDSQDETILLSGINTDACFKICGNDNDFLLYSMLDKNGFVIKITDYFGNFLGRASGFRNGNCVYINQLRTIYDFGGFGYVGQYKSEKTAIIETFKKACCDIVNSSQNNMNEKDKIDFVFVTKSYALSNCNVNISDEVTKYIGSCPMERDSKDWKNFVYNTKYLQEINDLNDFFSIDYGNYPLICIASSKKIIDKDDIKVEDIKPKNVKAVYERPRNKVRAITNLNQEVLKKINKIKAIDIYFKKSEFKQVKLPSQTIIFMGDNWYIAFNNGIIIDECLLSFDKKACVEYQIAKEIINDYVNQNNKGINEIKENITNEFAKKLIYKKETIV